MCRPVTFQRGTAGTLIYPHAGSPPIFCAACAASAGCTVQLVQAAPCSRLLRPCPGAVRSARVCHFHSGREAVLPLLPNRPARPAGLQCCGLPGYAGLTFERTQALNARASPGGVPGLHTPRGPAAQRASHSGRPRGMQLVARLPGAGGSRCVHAGKTRGRNPPGMAPPALARHSSTSNASSTTSASPAPTGTNVI